MAAAQDYDAIAAELTDGHEIVASKLFGMPTLKVKGKAFAGLFGEAMSFKLSPADLEAANEVPGAGSFDPSGMGRPMGGWVMVTAAGREHWRRLAEQALRFVSETAAKK
ncbi:MAG: hypothetical protein M3Z98_08845 [Candidatus Dormibacteraeota bacterium]|nr:hypothetical protein [Candidatus Dormibacteraeota bacterium]